ncbi:DUF87 domain-containing protein [Methanolobus sp. ZRKC3]|uniref:ATP-binding protein n=1 Tax=Methanolobus sp. ZRKC3 TaxID=3125786 RepID=UPI00325497F4
MLKFPMTMDYLADGFSAGVFKNQYVLGSLEGGEKARLYLGRYLARDGSTGSHVELDASRPHAILIAGKRGYGKSYSMGILVEELSLLPSDVRQGVASVIIDTMGIFWTLPRANAAQAEALSGWGMKPTGQDVDIFVPSGSEDAYEKRNIDVNCISIPIALMDGYEWCRLFGVDPLSSTGVLIVRVIEGLRSEHIYFSFDDIEDGIVGDERTDQISKGAADNYFRAARSWGIYSEKGKDISDMVKGGRVSVIDVSTIKNHAVRAAVVAFLAKEIYHQRLEARRSYERMLMGDGDVEEGIPMVWMFIDEAQQFVPSGRDTLASDVLINEWLRQGRQPGLSLVLATQRPSSLHQDVLSQSDIVVCHRLTSQDDIQALESVRPTYMREHFGDSIRKMGNDRGIAFVVDDTTESAHIIRMRPRMSWHGGDEPDLTKI